MNDASNAAPDDGRVRATVILSDPRAIAKIVHLALRHGCTYTHLRARRSGDRYEAQIEFEGPDDGLRRLRTQLEKLEREETTLLPNDKENP